MKNANIRTLVKSFFKRWKKDYVFKTFAGSAFSFCSTVFFAFYNGFLGISKMSLWHGSICVFYLLLAVIRSLVLFAQEKSKAKAKEEATATRYKAFAISAIILLVLNLSLVYPICLMVKFEKPVDIGLTPAIAMAAYTCYKITLATVNLSRQKKKNHNNILVTELRTINFIDALVSVLTLQNTLIMVNDTPSQRGSMATLTAATSAIIYALIAAITVRLLITGFKKIRINKKAAG